jgi:hypothetical protein
MTKCMWSFVLWLCFSSVALWAAEKTWTGEISDSMCGESHAAMWQQHQKAGAKEKQTDQTSDSQHAAAECTRVCVKEGGKYVLVSEGKVYEVQNQHFRGLQEHAGHAVQLTGELSGDGKTIWVSNIAMAEKNKKDKQ